MILPTFIFWYHVGRKLIWANATDIGTPLAAPNFETTVYDILYVFTIINSSKKCSAYPDGTFKTQKYFSTIYVTLLYTYSNGNKKLKKVFLK
jgi:hypothetical protein